MQKRFCRHIEIEAYSWHILPDALQHDMMDSIVHEYKVGAKKITMMKKNVRYRSLSPLTPLSPLAASLRMSRATRMQRIVRGHFLLARIYESPTVISNVLVGATLAGKFWPDLNVGLVMFAMLCLYSAGMYLHDLLDYVTDCRECPERPLPSGLVTRVCATNVMLLLFGVGCLCLLLSGGLVLLCGILLSMLLVCYARWHQQHPLSPFLMGLCRGMIYLCAFLACVTQYQIQQLWLVLIAGMLLVCYVTSLTALAQAERTITIPASIVLTTLFLPLLYIVTHISWTMLWWLPLAAGFVGWNCYSIWLVYRRPRRSVRRAVGQLVAGIALVDALILAVVGSVVGGGIALVAFGVTLCLQRYARGT